MLWLIHRAMSAMYPRSPDFPGVADCGLDAFLVRFRRETTGLIFFGVLAGSIVFHLTPLLTVYVPLPAFLLPKGLLDRHALRLTTSRVYLLRQLVFLVKVIAGLCWGADPEVRRRLALPELAPDPGTWKSE